MNAQQQSAQAFAARWKDRGDNERGETQSFWNELLQEVFGVPLADHYIDFERPIKGWDKGGFYDGYIPSTRVLIEQKKRSVHLAGNRSESDGTQRTAYGQAKFYADNMDYDDRPRYIITCNFSDFYIYNQYSIHSDPIHVPLAALAENLHLLEFLVDYDKRPQPKEEKVSIAAGEQVEVLYSLLRPLYLHPDAPESQHALNVLCVRLVFCLYAEDAGIFPRNLFHDYLASFHPDNAREGLLRLFEVLDTPEPQRDPYLREDLLRFPYVNGGLFADRRVEVPRLSSQFLDQLLKGASLGFDWSDISPTVFGAIFESTLNPDTRRRGGMHYTSPDNIHKVIDPLFLDSLRDRFNRAVAEPQPKARFRALRELQSHMASLRFLDPACGSGNFLTESFRSLRKLENEILILLSKGQSTLDLGEDSNPVRVSISQFYGIEINDFAATVAKTALWIAEHQMLKETARIVQTSDDFLPLKTYNNIRVGDALQMEWDKIEYEGPGVVDVYADNANLIPNDWGVAEPQAHYGNINLHYNTITSVNPVKQKQYRTVHYDYIMGNPPFVGFTYMTDEQKSSMAQLFPGAKNLDYVCGWYKKAGTLIKGTRTECAFVSTNSITQGETAARLWQYIDFRINFAYTTFVWDSESTQKAHVHCVIIGFADFDREQKVIYAPNAVVAKEINAYLLDAPQVIVGSRGKPLCDVPRMVYGNKPVDGGNLIIEESDYEEFLRKEPAAAAFVRPLLGAEEYIKGKKRWCLWLTQATPAQLRAMPHVMQRIHQCKGMREASVAAAIRKFAETPHLFAQRTQPDGVPYIILPCTSSERRRYVPMGFVDGNTIVTNLVQIIPDASLYHFGILTSNVHMAWMRAVCGRLESSYRYSKDVVYNNFPWPTPTDEQRQRIEQTAQAILDARALYPDSSLADLYDEAVMPPELRKAHQQNDRAVMAAYGFPVKNFTEQDCVAALMKMYQELTEKQ